MRTQSFFLATLTVATLSLAQKAQAANPEVSTSGKGVVGGALLGAEVVLSAEAAFKVKPAWAYLVGGLGGAVGGGVGGYAIEQNAGPRTTLFMLAGGMALAIPVTVLVLSQTAYEPPASYTQDKPPSDEPVAEPPQAAPTPAPAAPPTSISPGSTDVTSPVTTPPGSPATPQGNAPVGPTGALPRRDAKPRAVARHTLPLDYHLSPPALIGISEQALTLGVPAIELRDVYTRNEIAMYGVAQATELRVPVVNFLF